MNLGISQGQVQQLQLKAKAEKAKEAEVKEETSGKVNTQAGGYEPVTASAADAMAAMNMMLVEDGKVKGDNNNDDGACYTRYPSEGSFNLNGMSREECMKENGINQLALKDGDTIWFDDGSHAEIGWYYDPETGERKKKVIKFFGSDGQPV